MLKKINEGGVKSDSGFSIQIVHPEYLEYREGDHCMPISIGYNPKERKAYIYVSNLSKLDITQKNRITNNIKAAVKLLKGNFEVI